MTDDAKLLAALEAIRVEQVKTNHLLDQMLRLMPATKKYDRIAIAVEEIANKLPPP